MRIDLLTLFPEYFDSPLKQSIMGKAIDAGLIEVRTHDIRDYATDAHRTTDDSPYGGGSGMVMKAAPVIGCLEAARAAGAHTAEAKDTRVVLATPRGKPLTHRLALELTALKRIIIICGRYEGVDERIRDFVDMEVSIGDYVLSGGEPAALVIIDAVCRLVDGVIKRESALDDSFSDGLLEYPHYTRPEEFRGMKVPGVLLSGNHCEIEKWRRKESIRRTLKTRPDLMKGREFVEADKILLAEIEEEGG